MVFLEYRFPNSEAYKFIKEESFDSSLFYPYNEKYQ